MLHRSRFARRALLRAAFALLAATHAQAATKTVGGGVSCDFGSIQQALDSLPTSGTHLIRIASDQSYLGIHLDIHDLDVTLEGGYANCSETTPSGSNTTLDASGHSGDSVIHMDGDLHVVLNNLTLQNGSMGSDSHGGGINFAGHGYMTITNTSVLNNHCGYGAGLNISPDGHSDITLGSGTYLLNNVADHDGGGVRIEGDAVLHAIDAGVGILLNHADSGYGGGIAIVGPARADVAAPRGFAAGATISNNSAKFGGGVSVVAGDATGADAMLRLWTVDADRPVRIEANTASENGGGIYLKPRGYQQGTTTHLARARLCAFDYAIDANQAKDGSGIYADNDIAGNPMGSFVYLNTVGDVDAPCLAAPMPGQLHCAPGTKCNSISDGSARDNGGASTDGAALAIRPYSHLAASHLQMRGNFGGPVIVHTNAHGDAASIRTCLLADNTVFANDSLVHTFGNSPIAFDRCTIADNSLPAGNPVLSVEDDLSLTRSIVAQPGHVSMAESDGGSALAFTYLVASEIASLGGAGPSVFASTDPRFIDPAHGDYHLQAASPAVDFAPPATLRDLDLDYQSRDVQLPIVPDYVGIDAPEDLGAYERQAVGNLTLDPAFDLDTRLWAETTPGASHWDSTRDHTGSATSGSARIDAAQFQGAVSGLRQCVHLPGLADYTLSGFAINPGTNNFHGAAALHWRLRKDSNDCSGATDAEGDLYFPYSSPAAWRAPAAAATIPALALGAQFTRNTTVEVTMTLAPFGTAAASAWFDDISLTPLEPESDEIFTDGFEMP